MNQNQGLGTFVGSGGRITPARTNMFEITKLPLRPIIHYDGRCILLLHNFYLNNFPQQSVCLSHILAVLICLHAYRPAFVPEVKNGALARELVDKMLALCS